MTDSSSAANYLVFRNCERSGKISEDYICDDEEILLEMSSLGILEIDFQRVNTPCSKSSIFNEIYFLMARNKLSSAVFYLYEYCGAGEKFESETIYYQPVDRNWGLYIDSSFP